MIQRKFIRKCKLELTQDDDKDMLVLWGSSGLDSQKRKNLYNARIVFDVSKTKEGIYSNAHIKIFNINKENKDTMEILKEKTNIKLYAGYEEDFQNGTEHLIPIFQGQICHIDSQLYIDGETHLYCYSGIDLLHQKMPTVSMNAGSTFKMLFGAIRSGFANKGYDFNICDDSVLSKIIDGYATRIFTQKGYTVPHTYYIENYFNSFVKNISSKTKQIKWYFDDATRKIMLYNSSNKTDQNSSNISNSIELKRGVNIIAFDSSGREREFREKYFAERVDRKKNKQKRSKMEDFDFYNMSILMEQNINLEKIAKVSDMKEEGIDSNTLLNIKSLKYIGDTHGQSDEWRIDLELYEESGSN